MATAAKERHSYDGAKVRRLRDAKDWSRQTLAGEAGLSIAVITKAERETGGLDLDTIVKIARALGVTVDALLRK